MKKDGNTPKRNMQRYNINWEFDPTFSLWISRSTRGDGYAYCKACQSDIVSKSGATDLRRHSATTKHKNNAKKLDAPKKKEIPRSFAAIKDKRAIPLKIEEHDTDSLSDENNYFYTYNRKWETIPAFSEWLIASPTDKYHASCRACHSDLLIGNNGKFGLGIHAKGKKHILRMQELKKKDKTMVTEINASEMELSMQQLEDSEIQGEIMPIDAQNDHDNSPQDSNYTCTVKKRRCLHKYNHQWELDPCFSSWVTPVAKKESSAFCKVCSTEFDIGSLGKLALEEHAKEKKHMDLSSPPQTLAISPCKDAEIVVQSLNSEMEGGDISIYCSNEEMSSDAVPTDGNSLRKRYFQVYHPRWEKESVFRQWLTKSSKGSGFAFCKVCRKHLTIRRGGKSDLYTHSKTQKHLKHLELLCTMYEDTYVTDDDYLLNSIRRVLPRLDEDLVQIVSNYLVYDIGVEVKEDLIHVEANDFVNILKPIQARKLVNRWQKDCADHSSTPTDMKRHIDVSQIPMNSTYRQTLVDASDCTPLDDLTKVVAHTVDEAQSDSDNQQNMPSSPITLSMPDVFNLANDFQTTTVTNPSTTTATSVKISAPNKVEFQKGKEATLDKKEEEEEILDAQAQRRIKKGDWVEDFTIPSESLSTELLNALQTVERLYEPKLGELVRILADNIYNITKKPHIDDLRLISERITQEFACLQDPVGTADTTFNTVFIKLRNRMYTLRKRKSRLLRKERKKMQKLAESMRAVMPPYNKMLDDPEICL